MFLGAAASAGDNGCCARERLKREPTCGVSE